ncbi:MAG: winged helix-turn-helix domain-containing protein [Treponema sp.]|jgi:hypothetical protein|nr:winged helix-turn-helix domain-containing protein [Treponema sp.]
MRRYAAQWGVPAFYAASMVLVIFLAWNEQNTIRRGGSGPLYRNLMEQNAWIRRGFDPADILKVPGSGGQWVRFESMPPRVIYAPLPDLPKRTIFSPRGKKAEEFTVIIPIEIDDEAIAYLNREPGTVLPGINFASIGENWEIFLNGKLIRSEMHLDEQGQLKTRRNWRDVFFPVDSSLFIRGINILALRIVGDPSYRVTGLGYKAPHYMDDFRIIEKRQQNFLYVVLCGIFGFISIYYLLLFLYLRKKNERYYLFFCLYSLLLCIYAVTRSGMVHSLIPNSDITKRMEYISLLFTMPMLGIFIETIWKQKITKISWGFLTFCIYLAASQIFFCLQYGEEIIRIWIVTAILYYSYVFFYDIIYYYFWGRKKTASAGDTGAPLADIIIGSIAVYFCSVFDVVDVLFFGLSYNLFVYSAFVVQIGMTFALLKRFSGMYQGLEQSNAALETTVTERNQLLARIETSLSQTAVVPKSLAKGALSFDIIAGRAYVNSGGTSLDLLLTQREFAVLLLLVQSEGETLSAETIYENVWKQPLRGEKNTLKMTISNIRKKIEPSGYTVSVSRGKGYVFERI